MQRRGPWPVEDAEVEVERMALPKSSATRGFGLLVLLPPGPRSRAARRDEDARDSAAGRALRAVRAAPTKSSSPATPRLRCVGAEGRFSAPLSGPPASWRLFSGLGRKGVRRGAGAAAPAAAPSRAAAAAAAPAARAPAPAAGPRPAPLTRARRPPSPTAHPARPPLRDLGEPPPLSPRSPHALPGCAARSLLLSLPPPPPPPPSPPPPSSAEPPRPRRGQSEATKLRL
ncbi:uncharacterized protein LOC134760292 [Pongo abelii]|uniref:uncharacterized protein LOC134760292 n=1 Tax=Pongo abelii TaxID=9601 RepID=UPI003006CBBF